MPAAVPGTAGSSAWVGAVDVVPAGTRPAGGDGGAGAHGGRAPAARGLGAAAGEVVAGVHRRAEGVGRARWGGGAGVRAGAVGQVVEAGLAQAAGSGVPVRGDCRTERGCDKVPQR